MRTGKWGGVAREHLVDQRALVDLNLLILAVLPLDTRSASDRLAVVTVAFNMSTDPVYRHC